MRNKCKNKKIFKNLIKNDENDVKKFINYRIKIKNSNNKLITNFYIMKYYRILYRNNAFIPIKSNIKSGLTLPHGVYGIFISQGALIGENCTIFHQITIGSNTLEDTKRNGVPKIGNNVYIGAGAKIIGHVTIGNNVRIGANCVVAQDIPDNCTVVMSKQRIINHKTKKDNNFKKYSINKE